MPPQISRLPTDFAGRCAETKRRLIDGEPMSEQNLADALGLPLEFFRAAVAIGEALETGQTVMIGPAAPHRAN